MVETKQLQALDEKRDNAIIGLQTMVNGYTYHETEAIKNAAVQLKVFFNAQGSGISRMNYQAQSAVVAKITDSLQTEAQLASAVATLGLGQWVANLENANNQFEQVFKSRNTEISTNTSSASFGELKKESMPACPTSPGESLEPPSRASF